MSFVERAAQSVSKYWPGCAIALVTAVVADRLAGFVPGLSGLLLALAAGIALRMAGWVPWWAERGLDWCSRTPLLAGVALLGLHFAVDDVRAYGWPLLGAAALTAYVAYGIGVLAGRLLAVKTLTSTSLAASGAGGEGVGGEPSGGGAPTDALRRVRFGAVISGAIGVLIFIGLSQLTPAAEWLAAAPQPDRAAEQLTIWAGLGLPHPALAVAALDAAGHISTGEAMGSAALATAAALVMTRTVMLAPLRWVRPRNTQLRRPELVRPLAHFWYIPVFAVLAIYRASFGISPDVEETTTAIITMLLGVGLVSWGSSAWGSSLRLSASWRGAWRESALALIVVVTAVCTGGAAVWLIT